MKKANNNKTHTSLACQKPLNSPGPNSKVPLVPFQVLKEPSAHRVSSLIQLHRMFIDAFVGQVNERPSALIISFNDHLDDSPLAIMQDRGLEVLVVEMHFSIRVEETDSPIVVLEDGVREGLPLDVVRSPR